MEEVNQVEANAVQTDGTTPHEDTTTNGTHEEKKLVSPLEKSESSTVEEPSTKAEVAPVTVQKLKLSNVEIANLSKELDRLSKYNLKDIVVQILKSFPESESSVKEQIKALSAPKTPRQATPRRNSSSSPRATNNNNTQSSPSRPSTSRSTASSNPNLFSAGPTAKRVTVFLAGQELKNGQVLLINQGRTWQQFVDDVTNKLKFINNNIKIYSYPATNLLQSIEEVESGMQLLAALPNQKPTIQTAPALSPRKVTSSPAKTAAPASPARVTNAPPSVSVAPRKSDPGPISQRYNNNNNAGSSGPKRVYQPKTPTKQPETKPAETPKSGPTNSAEKKVMVRGPVQREVVTNPQKNVSVKDLLGAAKNSSPSKSGKDGWILPQKQAAQPTQPAQPEQPQQNEVPANNNTVSTETAPAQPVVETKPAQPAEPVVVQQPIQQEPVAQDPVQQEEPLQQEPVQPVQPEPVQKEPVQKAAVEAKQPPADIKPEPVVQQPIQQEPVAQEPVQPAPVAQAPIQQESPAEKPEEAARSPESPSKVETQRAAAVPVTSPEPKSDTQIAKDLDSKLLEVMNRRRMEQQQKQSS